MVDLSQLEKINTIEDDKIQSRASEAKSYLASTDWYVMRYVETQEAIPANVATNRAKARQYIKEAKQ